MEEEKRKAYSEVVEILKLIEDEHRIEQIPFEVIQLIKANADPLYKPEISKEKPLEDQNLRNETYSIMAWIATKYWNENIEEETQKEDIQNSAKIHKQEAVQDDLLNNAEIQKQDITQENINQTGEEKDTILAKSGAAYNDIEPEILEAANLPALVPEVKWYEKIKEKIIQILKFIFKKKRIQEGVNE